VCWLSIAGLFDLILCFHKHAGFVPSFSSLQTRFHAKADGRKGRKVPPAPTPPHLRRGARKLPSLIRRGQGWLISAPTLCFHRHSRFVPSFFVIPNPVSRQGAKVRKCHHPNPSSSEEGCLGNSPPWTGRGAQANINRLSRMARQSQGKSREGERPGSGRGSTRSEAPEADRRGWLEAPGQAPRRPRWHRATQGQQRT